MTALFTLGGADSVAEVAVGGTVVYRNRQYDPCRVEYGGSRCFCGALGWIFEHSPWVAERVWPSRPFAGTDALHSAMTSVVEEATLEEQLSLLRAHPDLGTRTRVSDASRGEQSGAGLDRLTPAEFERLTQWNAAYRERFGFPFLMR